MSNTLGLQVKVTGSALYLHKIIDGLYSNLANAQVIELPDGHAPHLVSREKFLLELQYFQKNH
jgi:hypothetical protein